MIENPLRGIARGIPAMGEFDNLSRTQAQEIDSLKEELREAKETLDAIRSGAADALVVARNGQGDGLTLSKTLITVPNLSRRNAGRRG